MKKNVITDLKTNKGKLSTINRMDIVEDPRRVSARPIPSPVKQPEKRLPSTPLYKKKQPLVRKKFIILLLIFIVLGGTFFTLNAFESTHILVTHKHQVYPLTNETFTASQDGSLPIHFDIMIVSDQENKEMILTQSAQVSEKAKAQVMLYNTYSTKPQTISGGTFVADPTGKTYKLDTTVKIPGYVTDKTNKSIIIPGQTAGSITAFLPGDSYNSTQTDFTITSFKGSQATKIYLKATTPVTGGAQGLVYTPTAAQLGILDAEAQTNFKNNITRKLVAQVPPGYILYPGASLFSYTIDNQIQSPTADALIPISGTISAVIFKHDDLSDAIINHVLPTISPFEHSEINLPDITNLTFAFSTPNQPITKDIQTISFTLSGSETFDWSPNVPTLTSSLVGAPYKNVSTILAHDPGITSASVKVFPPWKTYLPEDPSRIHIAIN